MAVVADQQWQAVRNALRQAADRFADLLLTAPATARATLDWTVADTAAHVVAIPPWYKSLLRPSDHPHPFPAYQDQIDAGNVDTVAVYNELVLRKFPVREPQALADRLRRDVAELLALTSDDDPTRTVSWFGGASLPIAGMFAHLLDELLVHGHDIAKAVGRRWEIPPEQAAMFFELFLLGLIRQGYGRLLDHGVPPPRRRIAVQFRSAYTTPVTLVLQDGLVSAAAPAPQDDVRITFHPSMLILMMFGRVGKLRAVLSGKVRVAGPRPWLLPLFLRTMHLPGRGDPRVLAALPA